MSENSMGSRLKHAWNAFLNRDPTEEFERYTGAPSVSYSYRPDRPRLSLINERSIITPVYNRISIDVSAIDIRHVQLDENQRFIKTMDSGINSCLALEANKDQTGRSFIQDVVISMLDEGCVAIVPIDTTLNPNTGSYDIESMRVGKIVEWFPDTVKVDLYNDRTGMKEQIKLPKKMVAIVENPFYIVMNEPNSTLQRLKRKLNLLDVVDERNGAGKLDLIIHLPYSTKSETRKKQAEKRREEMEEQLANSKYGVAYSDATERITQLNRSIENNLTSQVEYLTALFYSQLGITEEIMNGTASEEAMLNYYDRTIEPILSTITEEMKRKFLTKNARTRNQSIEFFRDPFKLVPTSKLAELSDKFTRNEIITSNEMRQIIGMKPSDDPHANELRNKNLSVSKDIDRLDVDGNLIEKGKSEE